MQLGSIWGHGGYVAPDWSADWLHRESAALLDGWAGGSYESLGEEQRSALQQRLRRQMRTNTYDPATDTITIGNARAAAIAQVIASLWLRPRREPHEVKTAGDEAEETREARAA